MAKPISVLIVDDQKLFASSMRIVIERSSRKQIEVVGTANDGGEAVDLVERLHPDVVLMDVRMPGMDGVAATRIIHGRHPEVRVIMLTTFDDTDYVRQALVDGAHGYLIKDIQPDELVGAIRMAHAGIFLFGPSVGGRLADEAGRSFAGEPQADPIASMYPTLSPREAEVLELIMQSYDNFEIGEKLAISEQTVKNYTSTIYAKLGVADRIHAIRLVKKRMRKEPGPVTGA